MYFILIWSPAVTFPITLKEKQGVPFLVDSIISTYLIGSPLFMKLSRLIDVSFNLIQSPVVAPIE